MKTFFRCMLAGALFVLLSVTILLVALVFAQSGTVQPERSIVFMSLGGLLLSLIVGLVLVFSKAATTPNVSVGGVYEDLDVGHCSSTRHVVQVLNQRLTAALVHEVEMKGV